jgi:hypothetical protein
VAFPHCASWLAIVNSFIFIGTRRIKEGKFEDFKNSYLDLVKVVEAKEPRLIAFYCYANDDETEVSVVQVHPDADSMLFHMQVACEHIEQGVQDLLDVGSMQIYGTPSDAAWEMMKTARQARGSSDRQTARPRRVHPLRRRGRLSSS